MEYTRLSDRLLVALLGRVRELASSQFESYLIQKHIYLGSILMSDYQILSPLTVRSLFFMKLVRCWALRPS